MEVRTMKLHHAMRSILGKKDENGYVDIGIQMGVNSLYKLLGLSSTPMLYNYANAKTLKIEPERALVILEKFDILIDLWSSEDALRADCTNRELGRKVAYAPIKEIIEDLLEVSKLGDCSEAHKALLAVIGKHY